MIVYSLIGDCPVSDLADCSVQPDSEVISGISSKLSQIENKSFISLVIPSHISDDIRNVSKDGCGVDVVGEVLQNHDHLFRNVLQGNVAQSHVVNGIRQVVVEERVVQFVTLAVEVPKVICSDVRDAAGSNV